MNIIADIGSNWKVGSESESRSRLEELIGLAKKCGAGTVKLQLFKADLLYRDKSKVDALRGLEFPEKWLDDAKSIADFYGLEFLVTPFYVGAVDVIDDLVSRYKIASTDLTYTPLLERISATRRPVILSVGGATKKEVDSALATLRPDLKIGSSLEGSGGGITLMHCVPSYPPPIGELNLREIIELGMRYFPIRVGFSSHCTDPYITASATLFGVNEIEVHFDLGDSLGIEHKHSYTPQTLRELVRYCDLLEMAMECRVSSSNENARRDSYRDSADWLRPPMVQ